MPMRWRLCGMALLAGTIGPGCAEPVLLCRRPEVAEEVSRVVQKWNVYNQLDPFSAREAPTTRANAVVCRAEMDTVGYQPTPNGWLPRPVRVPVHYAVQVRDHLVYVEVIP